MEINLAGTDWRSVENKNWRDELTSYTQMQNRSFQGVESCEMNKN